MDIEEQFPGVDVITGQRHRGGGAETQRGWGRDIKGGGGETQRTRTRTRKLYFPRIVV